MGDDGGEEGCDSGFDDAAGDHVESSEIRFIVAFVNAEIEVVCSVDLYVYEARTEDVSSEVDDGVGPLLANEECVLRRLWLARRPSV